MVGMATTQPTVDHVLAHWEAIRAHEVDTLARTDAFIADYVAARDQRAAETAAQVTDATNG